MPDYLDWANQEISYGDYPRPFLLEAVDLGTGATTEVVYRPISSVDPLGTTLDLHLSAERRDVVRTLVVADPVTDQVSERDYRFDGPVCADGICLGFSSREITSYRGNPDLDALLGAGSLAFESRTTSEFELHRDFVLRTHTRIDVDLRRQAARLRVRL